MLLLFSTTLIGVLGSAGIELIFRRSWLGWPKQPIQWDILYHVMSCTVLKWGAGWRKGIFYSGASWASGGESIRCSIFFLSLLLLLFSSPSAVLLNRFYHKPQVLPFSFWFSSTSHQGGGSSERATTWFFVAIWGSTTITGYHIFTFFLSYKDFFLRIPPGKIVNNSR